MESRASAAVPVVIVNPASAGGSTRRRWDEHAATLRAALGEFTPRFTERPGHATELARAALRDGARLVVAMGGDGTINEVVNGFFPDGDGAPATPGDAAFAVLPAGTGGDFVKTLGTSRDLAAAAAAIAAGAPRPVDVGRLTYVGPGGRPAVRHFINIASFGIGGLVDQLVNRSSKALGGKVSFYLATARATLQYQNARCRITLDDGAPTERAIYSVAVANGRFFGGGMKIAPDAALDDGRFDVVTIGDVGKVALMMQSRRIYQGTHVGLDFVSVARARKVVAEPLDDRPGAAPVLLDVDGEQPGRLPATFELLPGAIAVRG